MTNLRYFLVLCWPALVTLFVVRMFKQQPSDMQLERRLSAVPPPETREGLLHRHDAEVYEPLTDANPLPGVQMVYMYVNGSDPGVAGPRAFYGGSTSGGHSTWFCRLPIRSLVLVTAWLPRCISGCSELTRP